MSLFWIALRVVSTCTDHISILEQGYDYLLFRGNDLHRVVRHEDYLIDRVTGQCFSGTGGVFEYPAWGTSFITNRVCFIVRAGEMILWSDGRCMRYSSDLDGMLAYPVVVLMEDGSFSPAFVDAMTRVAYIYDYTADNVDYILSSTYISRDALLRRLI